MSTSSENTIRIYVMGSAYEVPRGLTIMSAMEHAGWRFTRGAGCRSGFCGACSTVYRQEGDYRLRFVLACQTEAEDGMYLVQLPFTPAPRVSYTLAELNHDENELLHPQDIEVMDYVQAALRGDIAQTASLSFDCIQCGLCSMRCPADIKHYHMAQMARRIYGRYMSPVTAHLEERITEIEKGVYEKEVEALVKMTRSELEEIYAARVVE